MRGKLPSTMKRSVMVSIKRLAISMLPLSRATYSQMSSRSVSARGAIRCAISAGHRQFREKAGATTVFYFLGKLPHGFLCDHAAFSTGQGRPRIVKRQKKFSALPLAFFPQGKGFLHGVFFRVQASALDRAARKSLLIRGKLYIHRLQNTGKPAREAMLEQFAPVFF